jgi:benzoyl-CoA reductase/2-hydroxyglutaryl-CoA dehydratase subunit BcrC/BadD/HgdB
MKSDAILQMKEWRTVFETLPVLRRFFAEDPDSHGMNAILAGLSSYLEKMVAHVDRGDPFVWYNLGFNPEIVHALGGVCPVATETLGAIHSIIADHSVVTGFIDRSHAESVPTDCCSADKIGAGAIHMGLYPEPAFAVGINTPCDAQVMNTQLLAEMSGAPFFSIDVPYYTDDRSIRHVASQIAELVPLLEKATGRRLETGRLREACARSNAMTEAIWDWLEARKRSPLTQSSKLVALTLILQVQFAGSEEGVMMARGLAREARERNERDERFFTERVRAVWYQDPVWTDIQIYDRFERDLGLTVPVDVFGYYANEGLIDLSTRDSMIYGLARKLAMCHPMARQFRSTMDVYIRDFMHLVEGWNGDCCIFAGHIACKHAWGGIGLFKEALRKAGIPLLIFEFDMFDPRITSYDDIYFEVERFVNEVVWPAKRRAGKG